MPVDKLGRYMNSAEFLAHANAAVKRTVGELEAKGINPAYIVRESGPVAGDAGLCANLPDPTSSDGDQ
jgi:hypothetical protein